MSSKRRNILSVILLLLAAVAWTYGQQMVRDYTSYLPRDTTAAATWYQAVESTTYPAIDNTTAAAAEDSSVAVSAVEKSYSVDTRLKKIRTFGFLLSIVGVAMAVTAVFLLWQKSPMLGPDGAMLLLAAAVGIYVFVYVWGSVVTLVPLNAILIFAVALAVRELWGWIRGGVCLSWCLVQRLAAGCPNPQLSLLVYAGWITAAVLCAGTVLIWMNGYLGVMPGIYVMIAGFFGIFCLWKYGADLQHFNTQLDHFQQGQPITVRSGAFAQTEEQLLRVQEQHEEAVRRAVTSERFKVELISNVSHDLRTPLTSILGYGELLQKEQLSAEGREQLARLNQKAGYMRDLVESLFELTKVSSGVIESKQEQIDLIRLLEQTIGLFDDQLMQAGLVVRRRYAADAVPVVTDGARMHQVFANLLGNAIKYALSGTRIHLEVREEEENVMIRMVNTASYEMDFQPEEIMQRFARGDKARSTKGSGLGLAIAQTYTESVGGQFHVAVDADQFSAIVTLPKTARNL